MFFHFIECKGGELDGLDIRFQYFVHPPEVQFHLLISLVGHLPGAVSIVIGDDLVILFPGEEKVQAAELRPCRVEAEKPQAGVGSSSGSLIQEAPVG